MNDLLNSIHYPEDIRKLSVEQLPDLCNELRNFLIDTISNIGGHFSSNLGTVELTVALHYVFHTPEDRFVWDVGHQSYIHKILTGRKDQLSTIRKLGGLAGFPKREESEYDIYNTGHAGTSISQALGESVARDHLKKKHNCFAVIGDASISSGIALEAMNHAGYLKTNFLVVLNDNDMSISQNIGSISNYLNHIISLRSYNQWKKYMYIFVKWLPIIGPSLEIFFRKIEKSLKNFLTPGGFFEDFGFKYIGPTDGHDVKKLVFLLKKIKKLKGPILFHVITQKGKGYDRAEKDPIKYHGVNIFNKKDGIVSEYSSQTKISYSQIVGKTLIELTKKNPKIVAVTPAMIEGSGLKEYAQVFSKNIYDVGMAEQHSIAFAGALASAGLIPYMCIYSTFLTRALDQLTQDVSLMNIPLKLVIDRAGCVGGDGETHQGFSDISYLLTLPNFSILAPSNSQDIIDCLKFIENFEDSPIAIRLSKESTNLKDLDFHNSPYKQIANKKLRVLQKGSDITLISIGFTLDIVKKVTKILENSDVTVTLIDLFWLSPLDISSLETCLSNSEKFSIVEESYPFSGITGYLLQQISPHFLSRYIPAYTFPRKPIQQGDRRKVLKHYNLSPDFIAKDILEKL